MNNNAFDRRYKVKYKELEILVEYSYEGIGIKGVFNVFINKKLVLQEDENFKNKGLFRPFWEQKKYKEINLEYGTYNIIIKRGESMLNKAIVPEIFVDGKIVGGAKIGNKMNYFIVIPYALFFLYLEIYNIDKNEFSGYISLFFIFNIIIFYYFNVIKFKKEINKNLNNK